VPTKPTLLGVWEHVSKNNNPGSFSSNPPKVYRLYSSSDPSSDQNKKNYFPPLESYKLKTKNLTITITIKKLLKFRKIEKGGGGIAFWIIGRRKGSEIYFCLIFYSVLFCTYSGKVVYEFSIFTEIIINK